MRMYSFVPSVLLVGLLILIASPGNTTADFENVSDEAETTSLLDEVFYNPTVEGYPLGTSTGNYAYQADCYCLNSENGNYVSYKGSGSQTGTYTYFDGGGTPQQGSGSYVGFIRVTCEGP